MEYQIINKIHQLPIELQEIIVEKQHKAYQLQHIENCKKNMRQVRLYGCYHLGHHIYEIRFFCRDLQNFNHTYEEKFIDTICLYLLNNYNRFAFVYRPYTHHIGYVRIWLYHQYIPDLKVLLRYIALSFYKLFPTCRVDFLDMKKFWYTGDPFKLQAIKENPLFYVI
jgi:hypothetical protein